MEYLTIFLENGKTYRFENVTSFKNNGEKLNFEYESMTTGKKVIATFDVAKVFGYSYVNDEG